MALFGWENAVDDAATGLVASSEAAGYSAAMLRVPLGAPSAAWQTMAGVTTATLTITPAASIDLRAVCLARTNLTTAATIRVEAGGYDSGTVSAGVVRGIGQGLHVLPVDEPATSILLTITDTANPDGCLNIPLIYAGPGQEFSSSPDSKSRGDVRRQDVTTRGGQVITDALSHARAWDIGIGFIRDVNGPWMDDLQSVAAAGVNVLFVPRLGHDRAPAEAIFGLLAPGARGFLGPTGDYRNWSAVITERL